MVISRVESVCRARWIRSNMSRVLPMRSAELVLFCGGLASTFGLGFFDHCSAVTMRCSSSRTLVKYSSTFSRSREPRAGCIFRACSRTVSRMLWPSAQAARLGLHLVGPALEEQPGEDAGRAEVGRHERAAARPGKAEALGRKRQAGEARLAADVLGRELVERDAVAEAGPALRMRRGGQEAVEGIVARADVGMRQAGDHGEVVAEVLERLQVGRELVVLAGLLREEVGRMHAQRRADADHAADRRRARRGAAAGLEVVEHRQGERHARGAEEVAAGEAVLAVEGPGVIVIRFDREDASLQARGWSRSLGSEQLALDDLVDQRAEAVVLVADRGDDRLDPGPVGGVGRAARGVGQQLRRRGRGRAGPCPPGAVA